MRTYENVAIDNATIIEYNAVIACIKELAMAMLTIRNLDESLKSQLRVRDAHHGCSMEEEVRDILRQELLSPKPQKKAGIPLA